MRKLSDYIINDTIYVDSPIKSIYDYIDDHNIIESGIQYNICNQTYEKWIDKLNISENNIDDELYKIYINENFNNQMRTYIGYQNYIYETLNQSLSTEELIKKLNNIFGCYHFVISNIKHQFKSFICEIDSEDILDNINFISLLSYYNYYVSNIQKINNTIRLEINPYKPKEISECIYNECKGILYHVTFKDNYDKIKKYGLKPINKGEDINKDEYKQIYRPYRLFFIASPNKEIIKTQLRQLSNTIIKDINQYTSNDKVILKIDLNKYRYKLKLYEDTNALGYAAYFTEEPIPPYCIELIIKNYE